MTTRILCFCTTAGEKTQSGGLQPHTSTSFIPIPSQRAGTLGVSPMADVATCTYSDVAALRSPSPRLEEKPTAELSKPVEMTQKYNSSYESESSQDEECPWTIVKHIHVHSLDLFQKNGDLTVHFTPQKNKLSTEQLMTIKATDDTLNSI